MRTAVALATSSCAACLAAFLVAAGTAAQAPLRALPDCAGKPQVRPARIILSCADANFGLQGVGWIGWGGTRAVGIGSAFVNVEPDAAGRVSSPHRAAMIGRNIRSRIY